MNFQPKTEKELAEQGLWADGEYDFEIVKAEYAVSGQNSKTPGTKYIKMTARIFNKDGGEKLINPILHPAMEWQLRSFCYEAGLDRQYETGTLEPQDCVSRTGKLQLRTEAANGKYAAKNIVKDWGCKAEKQKAAEKAALPTQPADEPENDDVPF
jgi:hypothetical protein